MPGCVISLLGPLNVLKAHCLIPPKVNHRQGWVGGKKKKKAFCSRFGFHPTAVIGTISRAGLFTLQRCGQMEEKNVFMVSPSPGLGSSRSQESSGVFWVGPGTDLLCLAK